MQTSFKPVTSTRTETFFETIFLQKCENRITTRLQGHVKDVSADCGSPVDDPWFIFCTYC